MEVQIYLELDTSLNNKPNLGLTSAVQIFYFKQNIWYIYCNAKKIIQLWILSRNIYL